jgi:hypothetical protein
MEYNGHINDYFYAWPAVLYMTGKPWRKMDIHGGYVAWGGLKICLKNSE